MLKSVGAMRRVLGSVADNADDASAAAVRAADAHARAMRDMARSVDYAAIMVGLLVVGALCYLSWKMDQK